jgi:hypothetical protein
MNRSIRPERPLDSTLLHVLRAVAEQAEHAGIDYMLVGATARDILMTHVFDVPAVRATYDVDFAVAVASWDQFAHLKSGLASTPGFTLHDTSQQRLFYTLTSSECGRCAHCAVVKSSICTARSATTYSYLRPSPNKFSLSMALFARARRAHWLLRELFE